ncbi:MAG: site-specific integrase [Thermodesulfobacteriota bacterium]
MRVSKQKNKDYEKLKREIGDDLKILLGLGYHHGLRKGEILNLRWNDVDFLENKITFEGEKTIKGETREVYLHSELIQLINAEYAYRNIHYPSSPWVCSRYGKKITYFAKSWKRACKKVGLDNLIFHDLRRSSIRNMIRSGISQTVAMKISGHRTPSIFRRYDITSGEDLKQATKKLEIYQNSLNGHKNATIPVEEGKNQSELLETIN